ncbi:hypothetical protein J3R82DRAFT_622 [Butyriboletus roseoflavus]|nr:hypothetical protein J3R82DRAFT_622 [Butyriboletus roseoflavus]
MSSNPSAKQRMLPEISGKFDFPWIPSNRGSPADTLPVHSTTGERHLGTDFSRTFGNLEEVAEGHPKRKPFFSFLSGRPSDLPALDDELFSEAKTSQSRPNWPSFFDVPEDSASRDHAAFRASILESVPHLLADSEGRKFYQGGKQRLNVMKRNKAEAKIIKHVQDIDKRRKFILTLAKCLLAFGSPSHRIDTQLSTASNILDAKAAFVLIPDVIIVTFGDEDVASVETHFVKAKGRIALTPLHQVHLVYRKVLHDKMTVEDGTQELKEILNARPVYSLWPRCLFSFLTASMVSAIVFGGSIIDMWISGFFACVLQYLGLNVASKSATYANVYEISIAIIVSFVSRALSTLPGDLFCYNAISAAGVVLILPGFTILISALELTSRNILCGSVRMVYATIYTLFLGFGLAIGSDIYLVINPHARRALEKKETPTYNVLHGSFRAENGTFPLGGAVFGFAKAASLDPNYLLRGCYRESSWPWWRQPLPWWLLPALVPTYSIASSLANLQKFWSWQLLVMVIFACLAFTANKLGNIFLPDDGDLVSAFGALIIGLLGNFYSRIVRGTAFTSMVTGVLFLVPSGIAQGGGLIDTDPNSTAQYSSGFSLAVRMIRVAIGITLGLFVSQIFVYALGRRKNAAHFAF